MSPRERGKMRGAYMQICPLLESAPNRTASTVSSKSASSRTTTGAFPPNSSTHLLKHDAAQPAIILPTLSLPVKFTLRTNGCLTAYSVTDGASSRLVGRKLRHPAGSPASTSARTTRYCDLGLFSDGLRTTVLPQINGVAIARAVKLVCCPVRGVY